MGKPPPTAPASTLERVSVQSPRPGASLLRCFALTSPLSRVPFPSLACHIHNDVLAANDESCPLEMKEAAPLAPTIAMAAGSSVSGDAGDEEGALIEDIIH